MRIPALALCALFFAAVSSAQATTVRVVASINVLSEPLQHVFAEEIASGDLVIEPLMSVGVDPHLYVPTRADLAQILSADLLLFIGLGLEAQFDDVLQRVSTRTDVAYVGNAVPAHMLLGKDCSSDNCLVDPHIWMDPSVYAYALSEAVRQINVALPHHNNRNDKLVRVEQLTAAVAADVQARFTASALDAPLVTAHDAFSYYGRAFGLETVGLAGISTDVDPSVRRVQQLVDRIVEDAIPAVFLESSVPPQGIQAVLSAAQARDHVVDIWGPLYTDSLGPAGSSADTWAGMLTANTWQITCALGQITLEDCP